jgi:calcium and integrin-binding protein 1
VGHNKNAKLSMNKILQYPELRVNPFGDRCCKVFSSSSDGTGDCTFEDFLDMMSVFCDAAPKNVKAEHAFRIFGECLARFFLIFQIELTDVLLRF